MDRHHDDDLFMFCLCFSFCLCLVNAIQVSTRLSTRLSTQVSTRVSTLYVDKGGFYTSVYPSVYLSVYTICRQELNYFIFFWSVILIWYFFHIHQEYLRVITSFFTVGFSTVRLSIASKTCLGCRHFWRYPRWCNDSFIPHI